MVKALTVTHRLESLLRLYCYIFCSLGLLDLQLGVLSNLKINAFIPVELFFLLGASHKEG